MKHRFFLLTLLAVFLAPASVFASEIKEWKDLQCGPDWAPIQGEAPVYPNRARARGIEGFIVMSYTITPQGKVTNIAVKEAKPANAFSRVATSALSRMQFPPCIQDGVATQQADVNIRYEFALVGR